MFVDSDGYFRQHPNDFDCSLIAIFNACKHYGIELDWDKYKKRFERKYKTHKGMSPQSIFMCAWECGLELHVGPPAQNYIEDTYGLGGILLLLGDYSNTETLSEGTSFYEQNVVVNIYNFYITTNGGS